MRIVYIADNGKQFDNEYDCEKYEWEQHHFGMSDGLHFFDINNDELTDYLSEETYNNVYHIIIYDEKAVQYIQDVAKYTGFCEYSNIDKTGVWKYEDNDPSFFGGHFVHVSDSL